ncbi:MAG TPA: fluoride efflux transporter CrcB [Thermomicrobiales bacterium]|nr:fluoride efflux transporter CrcB [Thermomicrobiales bacterium]
MSPYLLIAIGAIFGANARFLVSTWTANRIGVDFPYGTLLVNASGSCLMGLALTLLAGRLGDGADARALLATGFLGAYTTYSTFAYETAALIRQGSLRLACVNALGGVATGIAGAAGGIALGVWLGGHGG